jgi:shikimate kinase
MDTIPQRHVVFLIGFMGSGKTHYGRLLSEALGVPHVDLDAAIEEEEGMSVAAIFAEKGEDHFREQESRMLRSITVSFSGHMKENDHKIPIFGILSCGGGTPCFHHNMAWMNEQGITVWIAPDVDVLVSRLAGEKSKRPLIAGLDDVELKSQVVKRLADRDKYYSQAHLKITNPSVAIQELHEQILHASTFL